MSDNDPHDDDVPGDVVERNGRNEAQVLPLYKEDVGVSKRVRETVVRATRKTSTREAVIEEDLYRDQVIVERIAVNQAVDAVPPVRQEGDVTIFPVVEEVLVVERRLFVKEEVHLRRIRRQERHVEKVTLREQSVTVSRTDVEPESSSDLRSASLTKSMKENQHE